MRVINWFEIPVSNMSRARHCYETLLQIQLREENCGGMEMCVFPYTEPNTGGALTKMDTLQPSASGTLIYLNAGDALDPVLARVAEAGGQLILPRTAIGENGFIAIFKDTEGNHIGLHAMA